VYPDGSVLATARRLSQQTSVRRCIRPWSVEATVDNGTYASVSEISLAEKLDRTYVGDVLRLRLRLTLMAPEIVEAILDGRQPKRMRLPELMERAAAEWSDPRKLLWSPQESLRGHVSSHIRPVLRPGRDRLERRRRLQHAEVVMPPPDDL
jgi:hypothetical protein